MRNYLVVGCGLYGSVFGRALAEAGYKVTIIDKRNHIGGNCYTENIDNIPVHKYGPHAFHTNSKDVWQFVNRFANFNDFKLQIKVNYKNNIYSFPINLFTLNQLYGVANPVEARGVLAKLKSKSKKKNFETHILCNLGREIYAIFFEGYTKKQWNLDPAILSDSVAKRIPIRFDYNDYYFNDLYQGIPIGGYTPLFENMLDHKNINLVKSVDFFEHRKEFEKEYRQIIYSGKVDELLDYKYGLLEYRSLNFETKKYNKTFQGNSIINYTEESIPYTRIVEHKYFAKINQEKTIVTYEYPQDYDGKNTPFYPLPTQKNKILYEKYKKDVDNMSKYIVGGRLGRYIYLNMDQVIAMSLKDSREEICKKRTKK